MIHRFRGHEVGCRCQVVCGCSVNLTDGPRVAGGRMEPCETNSRRLSSRTAHGTSHTVPKCLAPTAKASHVKNAWRIFARRLPSFSNTDARNPYAPCLPTHGCTYLRSWSTGRV